MRRRKQLASRCRGGHSSEERWDSRGGSWCSGGSIKVGFEEGCSVDSEERRGERRRTREEALEEAEGRELELAEKRKRLRGDSRLV